VRIAHAPGFVAQLFCRPIRSRNLDGHPFPQSESTASQNHSRNFLGTVGGGVGKFNAWYNLSVATSLPWGDEARTPIAASAQSRKLVRPVREASLKIR